MTCDGLGVVDMMNDSFQQLVFAVRIRDAVIGLCNSLCLWDEFRNDPFVSLCFVRRSFKLLLFGIYLLQLLIQDGAALLVSPKARFRYRPCR